MRYYFTCTEKYVEPTKNNTLNIGHGLLEVYSEPNVAIKTKHPLDTYLVELEIDTSTHEESITLIKCVNGFPEGVKLVNITKIK